MTAGRPIAFPLDLAFSIPLLTRRLIMFRSISAKTPIIFSIPSVIGSSSFRQSTTKEPKTSFIFRFFANSMISQSCLVLRVIRLTSVAKMVSPGFTISRSFCNSARLVFVPVSYTHLDVYKRQALPFGWCGPFDGPRQ